MTIAIRNARTTDVPVIARLEADTYSNDSYPALFFYQALAQWPDGLLVADKPEHSDTMLGYALYAPASQPGEAWLMSVLVAEKGRGHGIGRQLCEHVLSQARQHNIQQLWLTVAPDNQAAVSLYRTLGFTEIRYATDYLGPGEDRLVMACSL